MRPLDRVMTLMDWMVNEFTFGAPGALLAVLYLAPNSPPKKGVFKKRNPPDREAAIAGVRNAAWDLTQLSDLTAKVNAQAEHGVKRYIFATFDELLRTQAKLVFKYGTGDAPLTDLAEALSAWWPSGEARQLAKTLDLHLARVAAPGWAREVQLTYQTVVDLIRESEERVRRTVPRW